MADAAAPHQATTASSSEEWIEIDAERTLQELELQAQLEEVEIQGEERPPGFTSTVAPWWRGKWMLLTVIAVTGFALAVAGGKGTIWTKLGNALALFPSSFPSAGSRVGKSDLYIAAMYLAPIVSLWVTATVILLLYARHWNAFWCRRRRGHAVVCGLGEKGLRSARRLLEQGYKVTGIDVDAGSDAAIDVRASGARVLEGDATQGHVLKTARVDRAAKVVCACLEDSANASIASQVEQLARSKPGKPGADASPSPIDVYVHLANPDLSGILRAPTFELELIRLHFFNIYELWAQALADRARLDEVAAETGVRPHVVIVGATGLARALAVCIARRWYRLCSDPDRRLRLTLVGPGAAAEATALGTRYPTMPRTVELCPVDQAVGTSSPVDPALLHEAAAAGFRTAIYFCLFDDAENLSLALQTRYHVPDGVTIVVPASAWTSELAGLLMRGSDRIEAVGYADKPDSFDLLLESWRELMAREVHRFYRRHNAVGTPADVDWEELPERLRDSNRQQVDTLDDHLRALWYGIAPLFEWDTLTPGFPEAEVELLAQLEHDRWCRERRSKGYVYGPRRDDAADPPTHPDLVGWDMLQESAKDKDRDAVRAWPPILREAGYGIVRSPQREPLAAAIHERHVQDRLAAGESATANPALVPWARLSEQQRDLNRSSADQIGVQLALIDAEIVPAPPPRERGRQPDVYRLTESGVERLAQIEHERWCRERVSRGWRLGPERDEVARTHPDLVDWADLPEDRRQIDREHVRAIPTLLESVGLWIRPKPLASSPERPGRWARGRGAPSRFLRRVRPPQTVEASAAAAPTSGVG